MQLLQIVQQFCGRTGLPVPEALFESGDEQVLQITYLANEVCEKIVELRSWTELQYSATWASVAGEDQGAIEDLAPELLLKIQNNVIWDRTTRLKVFGPLNAQEWQELKALQVTGPLYRYRIMQGRLLFIPDMEAGHEMAFDYVSGGIIYNAGTDETKQLFTADDDEFKLRYTLLLAGLRWAWKKEKGLPWLVDYQAWEVSVKSLAAGDGTKRNINLAESDNTITPGIWVPAGSWNLSN
jgi:hypothetical protein